MIRNRHDAAIRQLMRAALETDTAPVPGLAAGLVDVAKRMSPSPRPAGSDEVLPRLSAEADAPAITPHQHANRTVRGKRRMPPRGLDWMPTHRISRQALAALAATAVIIALITPSLMASVLSHRQPAGSLAGQSLSVGRLRLAALSPDTRPVDMYVKPLSSLGYTQQFRGLTYGTYSPQLTLAAGTYAVSIRPAGAKGTSEPIITTRIDMAAGSSYTVAMVGKKADLGLRVITDTPRFAGNAAEVRVVQASVRSPLVNVTIKAGPLFVANVPFGTITEYHPVARGSVIFETGATGGTAVPLNSNLQAGYAYSLVVTDGRHGTVSVQIRTDDTASDPFPVRVSAAGPAADHHDTMPGTAIDVSAACTALLLLAFALMMLRRRNHE